MKVLLSLILIVLFAATAKSSEPQRHYQYTTDQQRCQQEANYMASKQIMGHVWGTIGNFEGIGYGHSPNCSTCTPKNHMRLTGDAVARGKNGMWYRVRSWR